MSRRQYRVTWQRESRPPHSKGTGNSRARAERLVLYLEGKLEEATGHKRDEYRHCDGGICGCRGETWGERWDARVADLGDELQPLEWVRIETRTVEPWQASEDRP